MLWQKDTSINFDMKGDKMPNYSPISKAWSHINSIEWRSSGFDLNKAYVCALFSELAYYRIPDFELKNANRINVVPSFAYHDAVRKGRRDDFDQLMRSADFGQYFVVIRRCAIIVGVRTPNVIIISIRGTKYLYDWLVNFRAAKYQFQGRGGEVLFHKGFFRAIWACLSL
jgi:hypothetical protein